MGSLHRLVKLPSNWFSGRLENVKNIVANKLYINKKNEGGGLGAPTLSLFLVDISIVFDDVLNMFKVFDPRTN